MSVITKILLEQYETLGSIMLVCDFYRAIDISKF